jgi:hypothetical protein
MTRCSSTSRTTQNRLPTSPALWKQPRILCPQRRRPRDRPLRLRRDAGMERLRQRIAGRTWDPENAAMIPTASSSSASCKPATPPPGHPGFHHHRRTLHLPRRRHRNQSPRRSHLESGQERLSHGLRPHPRQGPRLPQPARPRHGALKAEGARRTLPPRHPLGGGNGK